MDEADIFVDHYRVLGVDPTCDARALEEAYHARAKQYHPDHTGDADVAKFAEVIAAYKALRDPDDRIAYDRSYAEHTGFEFGNQGPDPLPYGSAALSDAEAHARILQLLYRQRRSSAQEPGVGHYLLQETLACTDEAFEFHVWYLREKGFITITERGTLAITIAGVDHVIATSQAARRERFLISQQPGL